MRIKTALRWWLWTFGVLIAAHGSAGAAMLSYRAVDLADTAVGEDLWRYDYQVNGTFEPFGGLSLVFDAALYGALSKVQPVADPDWDAFLVQPDASLPAPGLLTATRLTADPAVDAPVSVQFTWLGAGTPGAQAFEVFDASFDVVERGLTHAVPEPRTVALLAFGLLALAARRSR